MSDVQTLRPSLNSKFSFQLKVGGHFKNWWDHPHKQTAVSLNETFCGFWSFSSLLTAFKIFHWNYWHYAETWNTRKRSAARRPSHQRVFAASHSVFYLHFAAADQSLLFFLLFHFKRPISCVVTSLWTKEAEHLSSCLWTKSHSKLQISVYFHYLCLEHQTSVLSKFIMCICEPSTCWSLIGREAAGTYYFYYCLTPQWS